jgi:spore maturation protein CgeB
MIKDFCKKNPNYQTLNYNELLNLYFTQGYWPSNTIERTLASKFNYQCISIIFNPHEKNKNFFFDKWLKDKDISKLNKDPFDNLLMQILYYKPNVIYFDEIFFYKENFFNKLKFLLKEVTILGWDGAISTSILYKNLKYVDCIFTCAKKKELFFKKKGIHSKNVGHYFNNSLLTHIPSSQNKSIDILFIGKLFGKQYSNRKSLLKYLIKKGVNLKVYGETDDIFLKKFITPPIYGLDMYKTIQQSKIVINMHVNSTGDFAYNIRLFETTGIGSFLLTDYKKGLSEKFIINEEIVTFKSNFEAYIKILHYLKNKRKREKIAISGQSRTLKNYTYEKFAELIHKEILYQNLEKSIDQRFNNILKFEEEVKKMEYKRTKNIEIRKNYNFSIQLNKLIQQISSFAKNDIKIAFYGAGVVSKILLNYVDNLVIIADKEQKGNNICHPLALNAYSFDYIIITVLGREVEIKEYLIKTLNIPKNKIISFEL